MKANNKFFPAVALASLLLLGAGCAANTDSQQADSQPTSDAVASADEMAGVKDVVEEGMTPIDGSQVKDGVYDITVDSSSSMFQIVSCELTVETAA